MEKASSFVNLATECSWAQASQVLLAWLCSLEGLERLAEAQSGTGREVAPWTLALSNAQGSGRLCFRRGDGSSITALGTMCCSSRRVTIGRLRS